MVHPFESLVFQMLRENRERESRQTGAGHGNIVWPLLEYRQVVGNEREGDTHRERERQAGKV